MKASEFFKEKNLLRDFDFNIFAMPETRTNKSFVFLESSSYLDIINNNEKITGVVTTKELVSDISKNIGTLVTKKPKQFFYSNYLKFFQEERQKKTKIDKSSSISMNSYIDKHNVSIGKNVIIEDNVHVKSGSKIGDGVIIGSGSIIGGDGFEVKDINGKVVWLPHNGKVIIGSEVQIGHNCTIDKGIFGVDTEIKAGTKIDNLVNIAHCCNIGKNCIITAGVIFAGSVKVGENVFFGPNSTISNGINISKGAHISLGSTVVSNVKENEKVTGYFALEHSKFMKNQIKILKNG